MVDWEKRNVISLHEKEDFYSHIRFEGFTNVNYIYAKKSVKILKFRRTSFFVCSKRDIIVS